MAKKEKSKDGVQEDGTYITTEKDFELYKKETEYWRDIFGIHDFEWCIRHDDTEDDARAQCWINSTGAIVHSILQKTWDFPPKEYEIEKVAFHEVMEIMLGDLWVLGERRFVTEEQMEIARHKVIRRLENCVWKEDFEKRRKKK